MRCNAALPDTLSGMERRQHDEGRVMSSPHRRRVGRRGTAHVRCGRRHGRGQRHQTGTRAVELSPRTPTPTGSSQRHLLRPLRDGHVTITARLAPPASPRTCSNEASCIRHARHPPDAEGGQKRCVALRGVPVSDDRHLLRELSPTRTKRSVGGDPLRR